MTENVHVGSIHAFNGETTELFKSMPAPPGTTTEQHIAVDVSGSTTKLTLLVRTTVALLTGGTNVPRVHLPKAGGMTAIIKAYQRVKAIKSEDATVIIVTDGYENCFQGDLGGVQVDFTGGHLISRCAEGTSALLADYFDQENVKLCIVALGNDAKEMVQTMCSKPNTYGAWVDSTANVKQVAAVVDVLRRVSSKTASSREPKHGVITVMDEDVQASIAKMTVAEMKELDAATATVTVEGGSIVTAGDLRIAIDEVVDGTDGIGGEVPFVRAAILLFLELAADEEMPAVLITGRTAIIEQPNWGNFKRVVNSCLARMAPRIVTRGPKVGEAGKHVQYKSAVIRCPPKSAQYRSNVPVAAVKGLATDGDYCTPRTEMTMSKAIAQANKKHKKV